MKVKKAKMSVWQKIFYIVSFILLIGAFIYLGTKNYNNSSKTMSDSEKFTLEFGIPQNNVFKYKKNSEILETLNTGSAIIFMAFPENNWSSYYASLLNEVAIKQNIKEIYFYNFYNDRKNSNYYYENIVDYLGSYTTVLDDETKNIYSPTLVIVKNGNVIYFDSETSIISGEHTIKEYWTNERKRLKSEEITNAIKIFKGNLS